MTVIIPKKKPKKTKENTVDNRSIWKKIDFNVFSHY